MRRIWDTREGQPSDLEDWVGCLADFEGGATGVFESAKTAAGRGDGPTGQDFCELNGSEGSLVYELGDPHRLRRARRGGALEAVDVPREFLASPGSPRDPHAGDPLQGFRYDQAWEFVQAIRQERPCRPSFADGVRVQAVMEAIVASAREERWVVVPRPAP
jgi:predicted dehydrogenase